MTRPDEVPNIDDDRLADRLAAFDAALASGIIIPLQLDLPSTEQARFDAARSIIEQLEQLWPRSGKPLPSGEPGPQLPYQFGRFWVRSELGSGGCGLVFLADDPVLGRPIALKVPRPVTLADAGLQRRFLREAQAAALLTHPHIIPVYEASAVGGVCFIAAEYCPGPTLARWLHDARMPLSARDAAQLVAALASAVGYAHARGVVHRDVKPSNVLMFGPSGAALSALVPKLTDFGFAKLLEHDDGTTRSGTIIGTPQYMAPEQATGRAVGPAADVYSLGVILYEVLTGRTPHVGSTPTDTLRRVVTEIPVRPRATRPDVPRDLEAVCLRCLEKDPSRRYPEGEALAADLSLFLAGRPTVARPVQWPEAAFRWCRRNPVVTALTLGLVAAVTTAVFFAGREYLRTKTLNADLTASLTRERDQAATLRDIQYVSEVRRAEWLGREKRYEQMWEVLIDINHHPGVADPREFAWHYLWRQARTRFALPGHSHPVTGIALSADERLVASSADGQAAVLVWSVDTGRRIAQLDCAPLLPRHVAWMGDTIAVVEGDRPEGVRVVLWDVVGSRRLSEHTLPFRAVSTAVSCPEEQLLLAGEHKDGGAVLATWGPTRGTQHLRREVGRYCTVRLAADGFQFALAHCGVAQSPECVLLLGKLDRPQEAVIIDRSAIEVTSLDFTPDSRRLVSYANDTTVTAWDLDPLRIAWRRTTDNEPVGGWVGWTTGGREVLSYRHSRSGSGKYFRLAATDSTILEERTDVPTPSAIGTSPNAGPLYIGMADGTVRLAQSRAAHPLAGHPSETWTLAFSPDGNTLATGADDATVKLWDVPTGREGATLRGHDGLVMDVAFAPDGRTIYSAGWDGTVRSWDVVGRTQKAVWRAHDAQVGGVAVSPDGRLVATKSRDGMLKVWQANTRELLHTLPGGAARNSRVTFGAGGAILASANTWVVDLWDPKTGQWRGDLRHTSAVWGLAASPDGRTLVTTDEGGMVTVWDSTTRRRKRSWWAHSGHTRAVAIDPTGKVIATAGFDDVVRLWHADTGQPLLSLGEHRADVYCVQFSPHGRVLASCSYDGAVHLWRAGE